MVNFSQAKFDQYVLENDNYKQAVQSLIDFIAFNQTNICTFIHKIGL